MSKVDDRAWDSWLELKLRVSKATESVKNESPEEREKRIQFLLRPENFEAACKYYFPHYIDCDFGWFHKRASDDLLKSDNVFVVLEWAREHAKSVFADVFIPLILKARGELTGMILASETEAKAAKLIGDVQAELMDNKRYRADFGEQHTSGVWSDGHFITADGIGFWSFGLGQNPAGVRNAEKRPNLGVVDDASSKKRAKNQERVKEDVDWVLGEFLGCLSIKGKRFIYANNRTAKNDLTAHIVGDINEGDPKRKGIKHIKVFATEDPKTHKMLLPENGGVPAWSRYTLKHISKRIEEMGYRNAMRQFYHLHIEDGDIFKDEQLPWGKCLSLDKYDALIVTVDPSWKDTKKNDFKAIVLIGKIGFHYHFIWCWLRQASKSAMVNAHYDIDLVIRGEQQMIGINRGKSEVNCPHYIEANFMQDLLLSEYELEGDQRGYQLRIRKDERAKPDKTGRIEDMSPLAERGYLLFNEAFRKSPDMITLRDQFLSFPNGHDDGPDACEAGVHILNKRAPKKREGRSFKTGKYKTNSARKA
jgi:hypothetical protein